MIQGTQDRKFTPRAFTGAKKSPPILPMFAFEYSEINFTPFYCSIELFGSLLL